MPEKTSEGTGDTAPEDILFAGSEPAQGANPENPPAPLSEPVGDVADAPVEDRNDDTDDSASAADALGDDADPSDALSGDAPEGDGDEANAPEAYDDFEIPEGVESFGEPVIAAFTEVARDLNLSQEQAQRLIDAIGPAQLEAQKAVVNNAVDSWVEKTRADKEIGGSNYKPSIANARKTIDRFGTPELKTLLTGKATRLVNHPEVLRLLARVGKAISPEKRLVRGGQPQPAKVNTQDPLSTPDQTADLLFGQTS